MKTSKFTLFYLIIYAMFYMKNTFHKNKQTINLQTNSHIPAVPARPDRN